jgi:hypothetical protein
MTKKGGAKKPKDRVGREHAHHPGYRQGKQEDR